MHNDLLKSIGFTDKQAQIYLALLNLGPSSVRKLADFCGLNRGTTYDTLKWLQEKELINYYQKESKQYFVAEDPEKLSRMIDSRQEELKTVKQKLGQTISELHALHNRGGGRPVARYYEKAEIREILTDVLKCCAVDSEKLYRIYSAEGIRPYLYEGFETFSDERVKRGIKVKVIAIGKGGELRGLDERKWLEVKNSTPTYIIIYPGKTAYISLNAKNELVGVVIENEGVFETQKNIFDNLWERL